MRADAGTAGRADMAAAQLSRDAARGCGLACRPKTTRDSAARGAEPRGKPHPRDTAGLAPGQYRGPAGSPQLDLLRGMQQTTVRRELYLGRAVGADQRRSARGSHTAAMPTTRSLTRTNSIHAASVSGCQPSPSHCPTRGRCNGSCGADALDLAQAANRFFISAKESGELSRSCGRTRLPSPRGFRLRGCASLSRPTSRHACRICGHGSQDAAQLIGLDWRLLAAVGYQESHWDDAGGLRRRRAGHHDADHRRRAGRWASGIATIRGRTFSVARAIWRRCCNTIPTRIAEPDRTWLALAAYNVGFGHLEDARILAQTHGKNPDSWADVSQELPCSRRTLVLRASSAAMRAAGSRPSLSSKCANIWRCSSGQPDDGVLAHGDRRGGTGIGSRGGSFGGTAAAARRKIPSAALPHSSFNTPPNTSTR